MRFARATLLLLAAVAVIVWVAAPPYLRAASLIVRAAHLGGRIEAAADAQARPVAILPPASVSTRHGAIPVRFYEPDGGANRTTLLIPGIHSMGIDEPRLRALAEQLAGSGVRVATIALPDLQRYLITPASVDVIEDVVAALAAREDLAPDGRIAIVGISFAGGLSIVAAGRPAIRDRIAGVLSFGGHGDLGRVLVYLATGTAPEVAPLRIHPPHDYGVAVILHGLADRVVPAEQAEPLRQGVRTFLLASQLTLVDMRKADAAFAEARDIASGLPEPSATYLTFVNERNVKALGAMLAPHLQSVSAESAAASPQGAPSVPSAPVYLLHGDDDTVIPAVESALLGAYLRERGADVHVLLSGLITHAEVDRTAAVADVFRLVRFWAGFLGR